MCTYYFFAPCDLCIPITVVQLPVARSRTTCCAGLRARGGLALCPGTQELDLPYENSTKYKDETLKSRFLRLLPLKPREPNKTHNLDRNTKDHALYTYIYIYISLYLYIYV